MDSQKRLEMIEKLSEILGINLAIKSRQREVVWARYACFYLLSKNGFTPSETGRIFKMSHTIVIIGSSNFADMLSIGDAISVRFWDKLKYLKVSKVVKMTFEIEKT